MKLILLIIVFFALSGLVSAMQPLINNNGNYPYTEKSIKTKQGNLFNASIQERQIRLSNIFNTSTLVSDLSLGFPENIAANSTDSLALVALYNSTGGADWYDNSSWLTDPVGSWYGITLDGTGRVKKIDLNMNNLVGPIPSAIGNLSNLSELLLYSNELSGNIPVEFWNLTNLTWLQLDDNHLTGSLPSGIGNFLSLKIFYLSYNQLTGNIPSELGNLTQLTVLDLNHNQFSGALPSEFGNLTKLFYLYLNNNQLSGSIPSGLGNVNSLNEINISNNQLSGVIPNGIGNMSGLYFLAIEVNKFHFCNIEPIFGWANYDNIVTDFTYSPQSNIGVDRTQYAALGLPLHIAIVGYKAGEFDHFTWYKNNVLLPAETDTTVDFSVAAPENVGTYRCVITNTLVTSLTLNSKNVEIITFTNIRPVANAGSNQTMEEGDIVELNGSLSSDGNGNPLTFNWTAPIGITLSNNSSATPTFTAPEVTHDTTFAFILVVFDSFEFSEPDTVQVTVSQVNKIPLANAGRDQNVNESVEVELDGSSSSDGDNNPLTFEWTAPSGITLSDITAETPTFISPVVTHDTTYTFVLVVFDSFDYSEPDTVLVNVMDANKIPLANAGPNQRVNEGILVHITGSLSSDDDSDPLTFEWTAPAKITLSDNTSETPTFTAPEVTHDTTFTIVLVVFDSFDYSEPDTVLITVLQVNKIPVANAGLNRTVAEGVEVELFGSLSWDGDGNPLTFEWTAPTGIILNNNTSDRPTFTAPEVKHDTTYTFKLRVFDNYDYSPNDTVLITVTQVNKIPVANAGPDQTIDEGVLVQLTGSLSSDGDGNPLTYGWTAPAGITLNSTTLETPTFTTPEVLNDSILTFELVVFDGFEYSTPDTVLVTVKDTDVAVPETLAVANTTVETGESACFNALQTITVAGNEAFPVVFGTGSTVNLIAGQNIRFLPGFHANSGSLVHAFISTTDFCFPPGDPTESVISEKGVVIEREISDKNPVGIEKSFKVYPNPSNGLVTVELMNYDQPAQIAIYNTLGTKVYSTVAALSVELNLCHIEKGLYIVQVTSKESIQTRKVLIN